MTAPVAQTYSVYIHMNPTDFDDDYLPVMRLWMLRALVNCNAMRNFVRDSRVGDRPAALMLGFTADEVDDSYCATAFRRSLPQRLAALEATAPKLPERPLLATNLRRLADHLGLDAGERDVLHMACAVSLQPEVREVLDHVGELTTASLCVLVGECLGLPTREVQRVLDRRGRLARSALLRVDDHRRHAFHHKLDLLDGFAESLMLEHEDLLDLFSHSVVRSPAARLGMDDFSHLASERDILRRYLPAVIEAGRAGVNVLVYGRPGTGKTELVRALAADMGLPLHEVPTEDPDGSPRQGKKRFESYRFAQALLGRPGQSHLLLFDEVEDVFADARDDDRHGENASGLKGWVNRMLEQNPVPTFWLTNRVRGIDPAYVRRFDLVVHVDVPPPTVRRVLIDRHLADVAVSDDWRVRAAKHPDLAPAVIERAARVSRVVCSAAADRSPDDVVTQVMNGTLTALGIDRLPATADEPTGPFRLDLVNADCDLDALCEGLKRVGEGRLCLYGPPGTGKSAFGRHIADVLGRPLLVRRASDLLSPYVGMAERNIARMFDEAQREEAVLLLDEADSFIRDRRGAQRSWEVTQVNEMLTQMEAYRGVFVASTNMVDTMDPASARRFDARIRFAQLRSTQAVALLVGMLDRFGIFADQAAVSAMSDLPGLTPGDFASVERRLKLTMARNATDVITMLQQALAAHAARSCGPQIGFVRTPIRMAA